MLQFGVSDKVVMIGDSITDCQRTVPSGEGLFEPYGRGYVNIVNGLLGAVYPELKIRIVNKGCSGNTVRDLRARWQADVVDLKPQWVSVMIGINDVWRQFDSPLQKEQHVSLADFGGILHKLVSATLPKVNGMILMAPYFIEPNRDDPMRRLMDRYGGAVKEIATEFKTMFIDTQAVFDQFCENYHSAYLAWDRIHPSTVGHAIIARAFLQAVGFEWQ